MILISIFLKCVEENIDFSYKGMGMSDALSYKYNRENFNRQVAKNAKNVK